MSVEGIAQRALRLKSELERMRSLLAAQPTVQQVIVFGSTATGQTHEWSDLDVMVIEESEAPFIERGLRLARLVRPQVGRNSWSTHRRKFRLWPKSRSCGLKCWARGKYCRYNLI